MPSIGKMYVATNVNSSKYLQDFCHLWELSNVALGR